jgi:hypothetical protein
MTAGVPSIVDPYLRAWNEPDPAARQALLAAVWDETGTYTDPTAHVEGRAALDAHIGRFLAANPGALFTLTAPIDHHHQSVRFFWRLRFANGQALDGMDYGELSPAGKLAKIVGFF